MNTIYLAEHHHQVYHAWHRRGAAGLSVAHVDFHCDMRGLLIDRGTGAAFFTSDREAGIVDRGNYLAHAVMAGMVTKLSWLHDREGGRAFDVGPVVAYESDPLAPFQKRAFKASDRPSVRFEYEERLLDDWQGLSPGEELDLDWDALASIEYDAAKQDALISGFLEKDGAVPETTFLVYSPGYSNPDRTLFNAFKRELARKYKADIVVLPELADAEVERPASRIKSAVKRVVPQPVIAAKKGFMGQMHRAFYARDVDYVRSASANGA